MVVVLTSLPMTSPAARSNASNGSANFKMLLHVKLLTAQRTLSQLVRIRCFRKTVILILYSAQIAQPQHATDKTVIRNSQWSTNEHIHCTVTGTSVITRSSLLLAMLVERILCMPYKIRCNPMQPLYGALQEPYVPVPVKRCALVSNRYTYAPPRYRTSSYRKPLFPLRISMERSCCLVFDGVGLEGFKSRANTFLVALLLAPFLSSSVFSFAFLSMGRYCGIGVFGLTRSISISPSLALSTYFNNNNKNKTGLMRK